MKSLKVKGEKAEMIARLLDYNEIEYELIDEGIAVNDIDYTKLLAMNERINNKFEYMPLINKIEVISLISGIVKDLKNEGIEISIDLTTLKTSLDGDGYMSVWIVEITDCNKEIEISQLENIIDDTLSIVRNVFIESVLLEGSWENKVNMILLEY